MSTGSQGQGLGQGQGQDQRQGQAQRQSQGQGQGQTKEFFWSRVLPGMGLLLLIGILALLVFQRENQSPSSNISPQRVQEERDYATLLQEQGLYKEAIEAYRNYLSVSNLDTDKRANIHYLMATIYQEKLHDFEGAMAEYLRVKHLAPQSTLISEINRRLVECLERMERPLDAQRTLKDSTALKTGDRPKEDSAGEDAAHKDNAVNVVAKIGDRLITLQDLHDEIQSLPPDMQKKYESPKEQLQFLQQYVARELLYGTALRRGYDQDQQIREGIDRVRKELMVQKLVSEEVKDKVQISDAECQLYYEAHKAQYEVKGGQSAAGSAAAGSGGRAHVGSSQDFATIHPRIESDLRKEKEQEAYQKLMQKTLAAEANEVQIFDYLFTQQGKNEK
jgi:tetratricopeptide (TPR) repeat protein